MNFIILIREEFCASNDPTPLSVVGEKKTFLRSYFFEIAPVTFKDIVSCAIMVYKYLCKPENILMPDFSGNKSIKDVFINTHKEVLDIKLQIKGPPAPVWCNFP